MTQLDQKTVGQFQELIWQFYRQHQRIFAWRHTQSAYQVVVSEVMLQQTQTHRVIDKFEQFITTFADFQALANAPLKDLLSVWQGLGYNRRALYLQKLAQIVVHDHQGILPQDPELLVTFPGIGKATAASICAFAFNMPTIFIETNIRSVFIHHFFAGHDAVADQQIMPLVAQTLDKNAPRDWYYALMDYGVMLKATHKNPNQKSVHYAKQSRFEGSDRQVRGKIIALLVEGAALTMQMIEEIANRPKEKIEKIVQSLIDDGLVQWEQEKIVIK